MKIEELRHLLANGEGQVNEDWDLDLVKAYYYWLGFTRGALADLEDAQDAIDAYEDEINCILEML